MDVSPRPRRAGPPLGRGLRRGSPTLPPFSTRLLGRGDQDGNPHARARTLRDALRAQKQMVLARYRDSVHAISVQFSQSTAGTGADPLLAASIADDEARMPEAAHDLGDRNQTEPYRRKLTLIRHRLETSLAQLQGVRAAERPRTARELLDDLDLVDAALRRQRGALFATASCWSLRRQVAASTSHGFASTSGCTLRGLREVASTILRQCGQLDGSLDDSRGVGGRVLARAMQQRGRTSAP